MYSLRSFSIDYAGVMRAVCPGSAGLDNASGSARLSFELARAEALR